MDNLTLKVLGGKMHYAILTSKLDPRDYAIKKVNIWFTMLNNYQKPKKWLKANSKGTSVNFDTITCQYDYDSGLLDLEKYIDEVNKEYDLDFKITR